MQNVLNLSRYTEMLKALDTDVVTEDTESSEIDLSLITNKENLEKIMVTSLSLATACSRRLLEIRTHDKLVEEVQINE
ncbi:hypothetical protein BM526_18820 (plasmid) [Alteromonas mediterranea]|uniref:hypothetical protein n=1 Tax=Alteromonas mediterranea TaxID=314275 RepID=UPI000904104D|nr:hypothetical protein [Alteromonas mediterranea]APE04023.1 hypothetical protein BM526_18820 [Alteromonas mediterranea]